MDKIQLTVTRGEVRELAANMAEHLSRVKTAPAEHRQKELVGLYLVLQEALTVDGDDAMELGGLPKWGYTLLGKLLLAPAAPTLEKLLEARYGWTLAQTVKAYGDGQLKARKAAKGKKPAPKRPVAKPAPKVKVTEPGPPVPVVAS